MATEAFPINPGFWAFRTPVYFLKVIKIMFT